MRCSTFCRSTILLSALALLAACGGGQSGPDWAVDHLTVPQHPFLAPNGRSNMHNDAYMTDTYEVAGPEGEGAEVELARFADGMHTCVTLAFDGQDRILTTSAEMLSFRILLLHPDRLEILSEYDLPPRDISDPLFPYDDTSGAAYFVLDSQDRVVLSDAENAVQVLAVSESSGELELVRRYDLSAHVVPMEPPARDHVQMAIPDWSGKYLWFTTRYGKVGTLDRDSGAVRATELEGEEIQNSFAVGEDGVYIVSDHAMYRFSHDGAGAPAVDWRTAYDRGSRVKISNFNQGSGTTPQLFGELVAICDNAEPRMNVLFLRRADGAEVARMPVFEDGLSTTENGLPGLVRQGEHGLEYSVVVDNNYGIDRNAVLSAGRCWTEHAGGLVRVDLIPDASGAYACRQVWQSAEKSSQVLPKLSLANGLLYVYTYEWTEAEDYTWYLTGVDFETGQTALRIPTGEGLDYANFGPPLTLGPDGSAYLGTMGGLVRVRDVP
ncbi:MAG: hypothetical protein JXR96_13940 [Deltaproteobacteria bacterium]|nr:hypothetical protein [Deltaproteobacteria bacterium]